MNHLIKYEDVMLNICKYLKDTDVINLYVAYLEPLKVNILHSMNNKCQHCHNICDGICPNNICSIRLCKRCSIMCIYCNKRYCSYHIRRFIPTNNRIIYCVYVCLKCNKIQERSFTKYYLV